MRNTSKRFFREAEEDAVSRSDQSERDGDRDSCADFSQAADCIRETGKQVV